RSPLLRLLGCSLVIASLIAGSARADATDDRRALVMLRVLAYDKQLTSRIGDAVRVVVVYSKGDDAESARWAGAFGKTTKLKVDGRPVVLSLHAFDSAEALDRVMRDLHPAAIVACDGLTRRITTADLAKLSRARHVLTFTTREAEVVRGLGVGIVPGSDRDEIVVNLAAVAAEGVKFDAGLLQLARTVKGEP
ncbi:MAG TPA: YfiR family protein, partial [Kofleriaceae bacterium]|nr:YfiR family protein [Kofleriaceae bacterium]